MLHCGSAEADDNYYFFDAVCHRGERRAGAVPFDRKSLLDHVRIERELSEILGKKVDLVTEESLSPYLEKRIKADVKTFYIENNNIDNE